MSKVDSGPFYTCLSPHDFAEWTPIPRFYQTHLGEKHYETGKVTVLPFIKLCQELDLP